MIIVLDTNVMVSGLLKGSSNPGMIVRLVAAGRLKLVYDYRIMNEYRLVLRRAKFEFKQCDVETLLEQVEAEGVLVNPDPLKLELPDPTDLPFIEVALASHHTPLVTGNLKHFQNAEQMGIKVYAPADLLTLISK